MASAKIKSPEKDEVIVEEEIGIFERRIEQGTSSPKQEKRKRDDEFSVTLPSKYKRTSDGNRSATTTTAAVEQYSLSVPFWKTLNRRQPPFQTDQIGYFSLFNRADEKECFDDKRYLRGKCSYLYNNIIYKFCS
jgi:hypothetical protein